MTIPSHCAGVGRNLLFMTNPAPFGPSRGLAALSAECRPYMPAIAWRWSRSISRGLGLWYYLQRRPCVESYRQVQYFPDTAVCRGNGIRERAWPMRGRVHVHPLESYRPGDVDGHGRRQVRTEIIRGGETGMAECAAHRVEPFAGFEGRRGQGVPQVVKAAWR
jgi:hypothetical protein